VSVPTATLDGDRNDLDPAASGPGGQCNFIGSFDPWNRDRDAWDGQAGFDPSPTPEPDLRALYPSHGKYVEQVAAAAWQAVSHGYLRPLDGARLSIDAARAPVP
jgi:hypothetical protein